MWNTQIEIQQRPTMNMSSTSVIISVYNLGASSYVAEAGLELAILRPLPPDC